MKTCINEMQTIFLLCFLGLALPTSAQADTEFSPEAIDHYEQRVAPLLAEHCFKCHSHEGGRAKNGLMLDSRGSLLKGGESGPAVVPGQPDESLLMHAVNYESLEMPPEQRLSKQQIQNLRKWIELGAYAPGGYKQSPGHKAREELPWSFQPVRSPAPPRPESDWARNEIDQFVLAELGDARLWPLGDAAPETLLRRLFLDLIGLPPTVQQQQAFETNSENGLRNAIESVVDQLLDSPHFGERWGRHWLDTARYAESNGNNRNRVLRYAWRYRDSVIDSLNSDKPYDQFLAEQIAGDLLEASSEEERKEMRIATGFLAIGPKPYFPTIVPLDSDEPDRARYDWAAEQVGTTMSATMALTVGCARCHDHKFDPIPTSDYYALAGIFRSTDARFGMYYHLFGVAEGQAQRDFLYDWNLLVLNDELLEEIEPLQKVYYTLAKEENTLRRQLDHLPRQIADLQATISKVNGSLDRGTTHNEQQRLNELRTRLAWAESRLPVVEREKIELKDAFSYQVDQAIGVEDAANPSDVQLRINGEHDRPGSLVPRGFLSSVRFDGAPRRINPQQSGRKELAEWITHPNNPLTARVAVNRVWYHLFGRGIVNTLDNFGHRGELPTHPELLDHLAHRFVRDFDWSIKRLIRYIVLSRVYGLSSSETRAEPEHFRRDPQNKLYWRMSPRRLEAEAIRDSMLAVSGRLDLQRPGGSILTEFKYHADIHHTDLPRALELIDSNVRTVYVPTLRGHRHRLYDLFDYPDDEMVNSARNASTVPTQALYLMNNSSVMSYAKALADRVLNDETLRRDEDRLRRLYRLGYARSPTMAELARDFAFLRSSADAETSAAWSRLTHSMLISAEFLFRL